MKELRLTAGEDPDMGSWIEAGLFVEARRLCAYIYMMRISEYTVNSLANAACGDAWYTPYLSGPSLVFFFNKYGFVHKRLDREI